MSHHPDHFVVQGHGSREFTNPFYHTQNRRFSDLHHQYTLSVCVPETDSSIQPVQNQSISSDVRSLVVQEFLGLRRSPSLDRMGRRLLEDLACTLSKWFLGAGSRLVETCQKLICYGGGSTYRT